MDIRVATLAPEDQLSHRLVHDAIGHGGPILATSTARLYYLCLLVDFYRDRIDWNRFLQMLQPKQTDRLLCAYLLHGNRELGLRLPSAFDVDAAAGARRSCDHPGGRRIESRLADYGHRTSLALLTGRTRRERVKKAGAAVRSSVQRCSRNPWLAARRTERLGDTPLTNPQGRLPADCRRCCSSAHQGSVTGYRKGDVHVG